MFNDKVGTVLNFATFKKKKKTFQFPTSIWISWKKNWMQNKNLLKSYLSKVRAFEIKKSATHLKKELHLRKCIENGQGETWYQKLTGWDSYASQISPPLWLCLSFFPLKSLFNDDILQVVFTQSDCILGGSKSFVWIFCFCLHTDRIF